jgi:hypothetical protein
MLFKSTMSVRLIQKYNFESVVLFEHRNIDNICDTVYVYLYLSLTFYFLHFTHFKNTHKLQLRQQFFVRHIISHFD